MVVILARVVKCHARTCRWFKSDNVTFTVGSEYAPKKLAPRTYSSFSEASQEVGWSRYALIDSCYLGTFV